MGQAVVELTSGTKMTGRIANHEVAMDVPERLGCTDTGPTPTDLFVMSLSACALFYAYQFLSRRGVSTDGAKAQVEYEPGDKGIESIAVRVVIPGGLSPELAAGAQRMMDACYVKQSVDLPVKLTTSIE